MSNENPIDLRQDRRQWLKTSATALGASLISVPAAAGELAQGEKAPAAGAKAVSAEHGGRFFTPAQHAMVEELSETIIPADDHSGGAKAAKVADYIEEVLRNTLDDNLKNTWREGLRLVEIMSQHYHGKSFVAATPEDRFAVLKVLSDNDKMTELPEVRFFISLKDLTITGYYTSKIGIHDELEYKGNRILKEYVGCDDQGPATA